MWSNHRPLDGPHTNLLMSHLHCQRYLAPALLLLYGKISAIVAVMRKLCERFLRRCWKDWILWEVNKSKKYNGCFETFMVSTNPQVITRPFLHNFVNDYYYFKCRDAFRGIVNSYEDFSATSSQTVDISKNYFIRFANGLINETNTLVSSTLVRNLLFFWWKCIIFLYRTSLSKFEESSN